MVHRFFKVYMFLVRMIYVSQTATEAPDDALGAILKTARKNNEKHDLTGLMVYNRKYFLQVIEGSRPAVSQLLGNLFRDPRHEKMEVLEFDAIEQRSFSQWSMQFAPADAVTKKLLLRYGASGQFEPHHFTKSRALGFLTELSTLTP